MTYNFFKQWSPIHYIKFEFQLSTFLLDLLLKVLMIIKWPKLASQMSKWAIGVDCAVNPCKLQTQLADYVKTVRVINPLRS